MNRIAEGLTSGEHFVTVTDANGCEQVASVIITTQPGDIPAPEITSRFSECPGESLLLFVPENDGTTYTWRLPDGSTVAGASLTLEDITAAEVGAYTITATVAGCGNRSSDFTLNAAPLLPATEELSPASCGLPNGAARVVPGAGQPPFTYRWDEGSESDVVGTLAPGIHSVTVTDANGCERVGTVDIGNSGEEVPVPQIFALGGSCPGDSLELSVESVEGTRYEWTRPDGSTVADVAQLILPDLGVADEGTYTLAAATEGCGESRVAYELTLAGVPPVTTPDTISCGSLLEVSFLETDSRISWADPSVASSGRITQPGTYRFLRTSEEGCTVRDSLAVSFQLLPEIDLPDSLIVPECTPVLLDPLVAADPEMLRYDWQSDELQNICPDCPTIRFFPDRPSVVNLTVTDPATNCSAAASVRVRVELSRDVYLPNAFSPNGDGVNDFFLVGLKNPATIVEHLQVFDRWGNLLFESRGFPVSDPNHGWNGTEAGKGLRPGVYVYTLQLRFIDGGTARYSGDVNLLR